MHALPTQRTFLREVKRSIRPGTRLATQRPLKNQQSWPALASMAVNLKRRGSELLRSKVRTGPASTRVVATATAMAAMIGRFTACALPRLHRPCDRHIAQAAPQRRAVRGSQHGSILTTSLPTLRQGSPPLDRALEFGDAVQRDLGGEGGWTLSSTRSPVRPRSPALASCVACGDRAALVLRHCAGRYVARRGANCSTSATRRASGSSRRGRSWRCGGSGESRTRTVRRAWPPAGRCPTSFSEE